MALGEAAGVAPDEAAARCGKVAAQVAARPGIGPAMVQPMWPALSPTTMFWAGMPDR